MSELLGGEFPSSRSSGFSGCSVSRENNCTWSQLMPSFQSNFYQTTTRELYDQGLSQSETEHCFGLHQLRARMERELRPHEHGVPDADTMTSEQPASTSGRRPSKEHVDDDDEMDIGEYSEGDSIFEESEGKSGNDNGDENAGTTNNEVGAAGVDDNEANTSNSSSDDDDPADVIVADVIADEAREQPIFTDEESNRVSLVLDQFNRLSGQLVNYQKSFVKFSPNTPDDYRDYLFASLRLGHRPHLGKYLGVHVDLGRAKCSTFYDLVDKIVRRIANFVYLRLSAAAKLVLINSFLISSIFHVLSVFQIPQSICDRIDSLCLRFWWCSSASSTSMAIRPSSLPHLPKGMGGLGIWKLLLSRLYKVKYPALFSYGSPPPYSPSWGYRGLLSGFKLLSQGLAWKVGSGSKVLIAYDSWVSDGPVTFKDSVLANAILALERPSVPTDDFVYWKFTHAGNYTMKSAYFVLVGNDFSTPPPSSIPVTWWKRFWGLCILPPFKIFIWKSRHNSMPVAATLYDRGMPVDPLCSFCHATPETAAHLFRDCSLITYWWHAFPLSSLVMLPLSEPFPVWCAHMFSFLSSCHSTPGELDAFITALWSCWIIRNDIQFRGTTFSPVALSSVLNIWCLGLKEDASLAATMSCYESSTAHPLPHPLIFFDGLLSANWAMTGVCLVIDGAWTPDNLAGVAWIFRDNNSHDSLGGGAQACILGSPLQAELKACALGLRAAVRKGYSSLLIYFDSASLVRMLQRRLIPPISISWLLGEVRSQFVSLTAFSVRKVPRSSVAEAHVLASRLVVAMLFRFRFNFCVCCFCL
ncbi:uncharacterized protein [Spinacia oleracea]|uniref:RNase H type-1 domain-containing protein n=1 Tax=Spinacia oleracea TaxID=3562 RepID=A0ABM3RSY6_SPIOL|nr:uncharacterized protein LOC110796886 [Spinacia oleracea]